MTIDTSIQKFAAAISESNERSEAELIALLESSGIDEAVAERTVRFTPVAFGRALLRDMGITFSDDFLRFDGDGNLVHSGKLSHDEVFVASVKNVPSLADSPAFEAIALSSSEVHTVNQMLNSGSNSADLVLAPVAIFDQMPTDAGMQLAQQHLAKLLQPDGSHDTPLKPWWKFW